MARLILLVALSFLPLLTSARLIGNPFLLKGSVYCDTCRAGFETDATKYLHGARVRIECKDRDTLRLTYSDEAVTDSKGKYSVLVSDDHGDQMCDAILVSSPDPECAVPDKGRDRACVILTRSNGMTSDERFANAMGFLKNEPMAGCTQILQKYQLNEDD
uniref:Allergen-like protein BRSn20 n=1 Tax=Sambucus nigra TaxID=4202 RepID=Q9SES4_SAMNI|nr:allergen-like protein BRSn20 [Sambucus nigra]